MKKGRGKGRKCKRKRKKGERKRENWKFKGKINSKLGRIKSKRAQQEPKNNISQEGKKSILERGWGGGGRE
jgi:hypothetical protein